MNKDIKKSIKQGFEAPAPKRKQEFLRRIPTPSISYFEFVCSQVSYIRKATWILSALIFAIALIGAGYLKKDMLLCISAFAPLLALSLVTESGRSEFYGMTEFELPARFSLKSVVLARLGILGVFNLILICSLIPFAFMNRDSTVLQTGVYIICPYLLTTFLGLWTVRKVHGKEAFYVCAGIATSVCAAIVMVYQTVPVLYAEHSFFGWIVALIILFAGTTNQCYQTIKQTEELA